MAIKELELVVQNRDDLPVAGEAQVGVSECEVHAPSENSGE